VLRRTCDKSSKHLLAEEGWCSAGVRGGFPPCRTRLEGQSGDGSIVWEQPHGPRLCADTACSIWPSTRTPRSQMLLVRALRESGTRQQSLYVALHQNCLLIVVLHWKVVCDFIHHIHSDMQLCHAITTIVQTLLRSRLGPASKPPEIQRLSCLFALDAGRFFGYLWASSFVVACIM